jgi:SAM-dependent methyltransferase
MAITEPFETHADQYEEWFSTFKAVYDTEVEALREVLPRSSAGSNAEGIDEKAPVGLEIGAGSGLFAAPLGVRHGVEPSPTMLKKAEARGIEMKLGVAEDLPYEDESFDYTLMVTSICFLDDLGKALAEIKRVLKAEGVAIFGFVDEDSPLGLLYQKYKDKDVFYRHARFRSASEIIRELKKNSFQVEAVRQTVFGSLEHITEIQGSREGHGEGGFVIIKARK